MPNRIMSNRAKRRVQNREKDLCSCGRKRAQGRQICTMCIQRYDRKKRNRRVLVSKGGTPMPGYGRIGPFEFDSYGLLPADGFGRLSSEDY